MNYRDLSAPPLESLDKRRYASVLADAQRAVEADATAPLDAVIHGVCVRLHTSKPLWRQFWSANWFAPDQWATLTGGLPLSDPQLHLYAVPAEEGAPPWAGYSGEHGTVFLKGDAPYGLLRALAFRAVAHKLAEEEGAYLFPGLCVKWDGRGILLVGAPGLDLATLLAILLEREEIYLVALDGIFVRYGLVRMVDGVTLLPTQIINEKGFTIPGYRLFPWLDECGYFEPRADARCLTLEGEEVYCFARDLDLGRAPEAFAFPSEQAWYVPTQVVAARPDLLGALWPDPEAQAEERGGLENVPPLTSGVLDAFGDWARRVARSTGALWQEAGQETLVEALCRLRAAPDGRAMVPPERLRPGRAGGHPCVALHIERVELLDREGPSPLDGAAFSEGLAGRGAYRFQIEEGESASILGTMLRRAT